MKDWTLDQWTQEVWGLYGHHDRQRSISNIWASLGIYVSNIAEGLRKAQYDEVFSGLAHTFVWLQAFVAKCTWDDQLAELYRLGEPLSDIVALKYPNKCSHCDHSGCICGVQRSLLEELKNKQEKEEELKEKRAEFQDQANYRQWRLDQWIGMFKSIFENSYMPLPVESIGFHLAEEVGEVARAIRRLVHEEGREHLPTNESEAARLELKVELADCMSWVAALFLRAKAVVESAGAGDGYFQIHEAPEFTNLLVKRFSRDGKLGCPACEYQNPCVCDLAIVRYVPEGS